MPRENKAAVKQSKKGGSAQCPSRLCKLGKIITFVVFAVCLNEKLFKLFCLFCCLHKACCSTGMILEGTL